MAWMEELCDLSRSAVDVIGRSWRTPFRRVVLAFHNFKYQHKIAMEIDEIHSKILDISTGRQKKAPKPNTVSFDDDVHALMTRLPTEDESFSVISVVGIKGIGKTILAMLVYNNDTIVDRFPYCAWTSATCKFQIPEDVMKVLMYYDTNKPVSWRDEMTQMVKAFLSDKRFLIVLDDAHCVSCFNEIIAAFQDTMSGRTMILTTCEMSLLSNLKLRSVNIPLELLNLRSEIVRRCGGLPLAIVKLADVLSQKDATIKEWSSVLQQFNGDLDLWSNTLNKINEDLPLYMKRCLFYFGLFPQDFEIPARN
ncbi:hypothetical protein PVL29_006770 [Vitis rotundifolia]|uniref:NB-ARC domain-containing protein n=1 Tax=Vitis rotundifolia TaxID=103349 RepID=A0AA39A6V5_VITRO|nr:hypothetical protein PVL29_006770 [Vitis rotundifolia]